MKLQISLLILGLVLLSGCAGGTSPSPASQQSAAESAFMQAPSDSAQFFYAVGEADTQRLAKNNALGEISSRISVSISSSIDNRLSVNRGDGIESTSQNIKTRVNAVAKTIEFTGVSVEETRESDDGLQVLVKVDRDLLYQSYVKKLERLDTKMKDEMARIKKSSVFYQLKLSFKMKKNLIQAEEYLLLLEAMSPRFEDKAYRAQYLNYEKALNKVKMKAVFSIKADKNSTSLASLIKERLSSENIKLSHSKANVKIQLSTKAELKSYKSSNSKIAKMKIVIRTTTIKAVDKKGVSLSNNVVKTKAASSISKEEAVSQTKQYQKLIDKNGILSFLSGNS